MADLSKYSLEELQAMLPADQAAPARDLSPMQRRMGVGHQGNTGQQAADTATHYAIQYPEEAGNAATDWASGRGWSPENAAKLGYTANVASQVPSVLLGAGAGSAVKPVLKGTGEWLMGTALKPSWEAWRTGKAERAIGTMLDEGYNATRGGVSAMKDRIANLGNQVSDAISGSSATVSKNAVADRLAKVLSDAELLGKDAASNVERVWTDFLTNPKIAGQDAIPVQLAQKMKQAWGKDLGDAAYGMGLKPAAERDARKAVVRGLKEEISTAVPEVAPLNAKESELINAMKIAERRALQQGNNNPLGLAALRMDDPLSAATFMADKSALAKSLAARLAYTGGKMAPSVGAILGGASRLPNEQ